MTRSRALGVVTAVALLATAGCSSPSDGGRSPSSGAPAPTSVSSVSTPPAPGSAAGAAACTTLRPQARPHPDGRAAGRAATVVAAVAARGWNAEAPVEEDGAPPGGMYVNWRSRWDGVTDPAANTNVRTDGRSDAVAKVDARHDPLNDLITLRNLDAYLATGASSAQTQRQAQTLRCRLHPVVAAEFADYGVYRGWVYFQLVDLSRLDPDGPWAASAQRLAGTLAGRFVDPVSHGVVDRRHGTYATDDAAQSVAALLDAGPRFGRADWTAAGAAAATRLVQAAPDAATGLFPDSMTSVPSAPRDTPKDTQARAGVQAQVLDGLLTAYDVGHDPAVLAAARRLATSLLDPAVGLADAAHGGFFFAVELDRGTVRGAYKESRQAWLLPALNHLLRSDPQAPTGAREAAAAMADVVADRLYRPADGGYVYRVAPDWSPYRHDAVVEDWVSTEATGIALQALLGPLS